MYRVFIFPVLVALGLTGCTNSSFSPTPTPTSTPTATTTPIKFSSLQLDDLIVQPYDLPAGISGAQISNHEDCNSAAGNKCAEYYIKLDLAYQDKQHGHVQIWVYEDSQYVTARYNVESDTFIAECQKTEGQCYPGDPKAVPDLGDSATMIDVYNYIGADSFYILFARCNAVVRIYIWGVANDPDGVITYAQHLDKRLTPIVCR